MFGRKVQHAMKKGPNSMKAFMKTRSQKDLSLVPKSLGTLTYTEYHVIHVCNCYISQLLAARTIPKWEQYCFKILKTELY